MNYYKQGDAANAEQIKAAFEAKGYHTGSWDYGDELFFFFSMNNGHIRAQRLPASNKDYEACLIDIIKTHPDYKELELPVKPNFKVNAWIISNITKDIYQVKDVPEYFKLQAQGQYRLQSYTDGSISYFWKNDVENTFHLWSIADAKDGDVLMTTNIRNCPFIYRKTDYKNNLAYYYAGIDGNGNFCEGCLKRTLYHFGSVSDVAPATKEQRELLFAKMREAGYEWDADKKELHKIQPHYDIANFKPFDKVLVRFCDGANWCCTLFSHYCTRGNCHFVCSGGSVTQCIPFNDDTKHLLGPTDMPSEEYINW